MNFKRYHVSRNLWNEDYTGISSSLTYTPVYVGDGTFTLSTDALDSSRNAPLFLLSGNVTSGASTPVNGVYNGLSRTVDSSNGYITIAFRNLGVPSDPSTHKTMLNTGSSPLPYEPYSSEVWHDTPHYIHNTSTDTLTTLPAVLYPNDTTATVGLKGNMVQNGTASPTTPIQPSETGERTAQLIDYTQSEQGGIDASGNLVSNTTLYRTTVYTPVDTSKTLWAHYTRYLLRLYFYKSDKTFISRIEVPVNSDYQVVYPQDAAYIKWTIYKGDGADITTVKNMNIMLNEGSTALPYENYGYKIPISSNSTTTPIYLGEVETVRQIGKCILTGNEDYSRYDADRHVFRVTNSSAGISRLPSTSGICTHFERTGSQADLADGQFTFDTSYIYFRIDSITYNSDFIAYIQGQYAAGTPVCVWYVLATPETAVVNEPLRKIGDYADTLSNVTIPVTAGGDTLSVDTTLQPSEVTVNYKGWHSVADVHERDDGAWT